MPEGTLSAKCFRITATAATAAAAAAAAAASATTAASTAAAATAADAAVGRWGWLLLTADHCCWLLLAVAGCYEITILHTHNKH